MIFTYSYYNPYRAYLYIRMEQYKSRSHCFSTDYYAHGAASLRGTGAMSMLLVRYASFQVNAESSISVPPECLIRKYHWPYG